MVTETRLIQKLSAGGFSFPGIIGKPPLGLGPFSAANAELEPTACPTAAVANAEL